MAIVWKAAVTLGVVFVFAFAVWLLVIFSV